MVGTSRPQVALVLALLMGGCGVAAPASGEATQVAEETRVETGVYVSIRSAKSFTVSVVYGSSEWVLGRASAHERRAFERPDWKEMANRADSISREGDFRVAPGCRFHSSPD